ncbi:MULTISPECIES: O-antigen ligase family protein [unclassified Nocardia]|uniref:O-antigen ligase family protein n=1 Tax=unclassified Nocardia TaxID=2637762 RepID=UPI0033ADEA27
MSYPRAAADVARPAPRAAPHVVAARATALLCLAAIALECVADILPDEPITWIVTPTRLVVLVGLLAVALTGESRFRTAFDLPIALLLIASAVANQLAGQPWSSWRGLLTVVAVYYLAVGVRRVVPDSWPAIALLALACTTIASIVALQQIVQETPTGFCRGAIDGSADVCGPDTMIRAVGTFANPNLLAAYLVLLLPVAAAGAASLADMRSRLVAGGLVVLGYLGVLLTGSRGGVIAAIAGLAVYVFLRRLRPGRHATTDRWVPWMIPLGAALVAGPVLVALVTRGKVGVRADVWTAAARLAADRPQGVGPARAGAHLTAAVDSTEQFQHAHNLWLNFAVEAGVGGLLAMLAITVVGTWTAVTASAAGSMTAPATAAGLCGFLVISLGDHPANTQRIAFAAAAIAAVLVTDETRRRQAQPAIDAQPWRAVSLFDETMPLPRDIARTLPRARAPERDRGRAGPGFVPTPRGTW